MTAPAGESIQPSDAANSNPTPIRAVVFDMDGLMFNSETIYDIVGQTLLERRGHTFTKKLKDAMMGLQPKFTFQVMIDMHDLDDDWQTLQIESNRIFLENIEGHLETLPGLMELLDALDAAGIPKAIGTSSCWELAEACLSRFDLIPRFEFVLTSESIANGKPNPEIYLTAAEKLGVKPEETMVLEDSHNGCKAAWSAGACTVAVPGEHSMDHDFSFVEFVADGLADPWIFKRLGITG